MSTLYMIGHSNYPLEQFKAMLKREKITLLYDIGMIP